MQHMNAEYFRLIEDYINDYREATGGCSPTLADIAGGLGLAKSTVSKYLKRMKEEGKVDFAWRRRISRNMSGCRWRCSAGESFSSCVPRATP